MARESWPFAHYYWETLTTGCTGCGRRRQCVIVYDVGPAGARTGTFDQFCWGCLRQDGDPLARMR